MQELYAIFADAPQEEVEVEEWKLDGRSPDQAFDEAAGSGALLGRTLKGMWIIDPLTEQADVTKVYGDVPGNIHQRMTPRTEEFKKRERDADN